MKLVDLKNQNKKSITNLKDIKFNGFENFLKNSKSITMPNGDVYVTGGYRDDADFSIRDVLKIDIRQKKIEKMSSMKIGRSSHGICAFGGAIYVCGGKKNGIDLLTSFEVYYPQDNEWIELHNCNNAVVRCLLVGFTQAGGPGYIYKIGGYGESGKFIFFN